MRVLDLRQQHNETACTRLLTSARRLVEGQLAASPKVERKYVHIPLVQQKAAIK